ncbi:MAG: hypothetical protein SH819_14510 [Cytophagales bacterium]|nr:hypothetical protein [Cytophagales bacterium]
MNSTGFRLLVKNFSDLTPAEYAKVQELSDRYPYSQLLHILKSRASKDQNQHNQVDLLHHAAVYATDRSVVKWAMTEPRSIRTEPSPPTVNELEPKPKAPEVLKPAKSQVQPVAVIETPPPKAPPAAVPLAKIELEGDDLLDDLAAELKKLQIHKQNFETSYQLLKKTLAQPATDIAAASAHAFPPTREPSLIDEIKSTRKKLKVASSKAIEQHEIIDQFIKASPALPKAKKDLPDADLAENSSSFSDHIVSETLVSILIKQGKKAKAIEMLKKLIWKYPQKKAYFAAQIEDLKN